MTKADKLELCDWMLVFSTAIARGFKHAARSHRRPRCVVGMASRGCRLLVFRQHRLASVSAFRLEVLDSASAEAKVPGNALVGDSRFSYLHKRVYCPCPLGRRIYAFSDRWDSWQDRACFPCPRHWSYCEAYQVLQIEKIDQVCLTCF